MSIWQIHFRFQWLYFLTQSWIEMEPRSMEQLYAAFFFKQLWVCPVYSHLGLKGRAYERRREVESWRSFGAGETREMVMEGRWPEGCCWPRSARTHGFCFDWSHQITLNTALDLTTWIQSWPQMPVKTQNRSLVYVSDKAAPVPCFG